MKTWVYRFSLLLPRSLPKLFSALLHGTPRRDPTSMVALRGTVGVTAVGMVRIVMRLDWTNPVTLAGIILGVLALRLVDAVFFGANVPLITSDRAALIALTVIIGVKVAFLNVWLRARGN